jgi:endonuclease YncB( thermonuclease family)
MNNSLNKFLLFIICWAVTASVAAARDTFKCVKVIDGDTIEISNGRKVRLIGVDTPEFYHPDKPEEYYSKKARAFTEKLVKGKMITIDYDSQTYDKYGRILAYVYLKDGTLVNSEIIRKGYGYAYTNFKFKYLDKFKECEDYARKNMLGLWENEGAYEFQWILKQGRTPAEIYEMTNNTWGIKYGDFLRSRLSGAELPVTLEALKEWTNTLSPGDLEKKLYENGWLKRKESAEERRGK